MRGWWSLAWLGLAAASSLGRIDRAKRSSEHCPAKWDVSKEIPYTIDSRFSSKEKSLIQSAIDGIVQHSCIHLTEGAPSGDSLEFSKISSGHCSSPIGRSSTPGAQSIKLKLSGNDGCQTVGGIQHEILHSFGFGHEMQRPDRDEYIDVDMGNVQSAPQFEKKSEAALEDCDFWGSDYKKKMGPLDFASVMMYSTKFAAKDPEKPTYTPKVQAEASGGGKGYLVSPAHKTYAKLSFGDKKRLNEVYGCTEGCDEHQCAQQGLAAKDQDGNCRCICSNEDLDPEPSGSDPGCTHAKKDRRRRNIEFPTCEGKVIQFDKDFQGVIDSVTITDDPLDTNIRDHVVECFNVMENTAKGKDLLHVSLFGSAYVDSGKGENSLSVTDNSMADAPVKWLNTGTIDTSKVAYVMAGSAWIELSTQQTNGYGVGFHAAVSRVDAAAYKASKSCNPSPEAQFKCYNGGKLKVSGGKCSCECREAWTGAKCEEFAKPACAKVFPCQNGGQFDEKACKCKCPPGDPDTGAKWMGDSCQYYDYCFSYTGLGSPAGGLVGQMGLPEITETDECKACHFRSIRSMMKCPVACEAPCKCENGMKAIGMKQGATAEQADQCKTVIAAGSMACPGPDGPDASTAMTAVMCGEECGLCVPD